MKSENKKTATLIFTVAISSVLMIIVDGIVKPPYFYKSVFKILLFILVPLIYFLIFKDEAKELKKLFVPKKKDFLLAVPVGIAIFSVVLGGYFALKNHIDFTPIRDSLVNGMGVTKETFLWVSLYIAFVNSLLEEFFFRGFAFLLLMRRGKRVFAYVFSSALFAFYHVGMLSGWFGIWIYILSLAGLFVGGCIFNFLNEKCDNIYPSWIAHMCANFAINTVGFMLFDII